MVRNLKSTNLSIEYIEKNIIKGTQQRLKFRKHRMGMEN